MNAWAGFAYGAGVAAVLGLIFTPLLDPFEGSFEGFSFPSCYILNGSVSLREWLTVQQAVRALRQDKSDQLIFDTLQSEINARSREWRLARDRLRVTERFREDAEKRCGAATSLPVDVSGNIWFFLNLEDQDDIQVRNGLAVILPSRQFETGFATSDCIVGHEALTDERLESLRSDEARSIQQLEAASAELEQARPIFTYEQSEIGRFERRIKMTEELPAVCWKYYPSDPDLYPN